MPCSVFSLGDTSSDSPLVIMCLIKASIPADCASWRIEKPICEPGAWFGRCFSGKLGSHYDSRAGPVRAPARPKSQDGDRKDPAMQLERVRGHVERGTEPR